MKLEDNQNQNPDKLDDDVAIDIHESENPPKLDVYRLEAIPLES